MRRSNLATLVYLAVVFVSGSVVGGFAVRLYLAKSVIAVGQPPQTRNHAELRRIYVQEMQNRLHLSGAQVTQLQEISEVTGQKIRDSRKTIDDEHAQKVNAILDDSQRLEYAKMREEREKRRQEQEARK